MVKPGDVFFAWVVAVAVDLFFNAGVFAPLFDQSREPSLLADQILFRRIPVAYFALAVGVSALAWVLKCAAVRGSAVGAVVGGATGLIFGVTGALWLWTAIEMTGLFVAAGILVQVSQLAAAGAVMGAVAGGTPRPRVRRWSVLVATVLAITAFAVQNLVA